MRVAAEVKLSDEQREQLERQARARSVRRAPGPTLENDLAGRRRISTQSITLPCMSSWRAAHVIVSATDFKSVGDGITYSYQTIRTSIYRTCSRQSHASSGYVSRQIVVILASSGASKTLGRN